MMAVATQYFLLIKKYKNIKISGTVKPRGFPPQGIPLLDKYARLAIKPKYKSDADATILKIKYDEIENKKIPKILLKRSISKNFDAI
jgi:hypothetical protein